MIRLFCSEMQEKVKNMTNDQKLDLVLEKISAMGKDIKALDEKVEALDKKFVVLDEKVEALDKKFVVLEEKVEKLNGEVIVLRRDVDILKNNVRLIDLRLENEISKGINIIGENHSNLSRNLQTIINTKQEDNTMILRVNRLEAQMEKVLAKIS